MAAVVVCQSVYVEDDDAAVWSVCYSPRRRDAAVTRPVMQCGRWRQTSLWSEAVL